jgi:hypothetical protein
VGKRLKFSGARTESRQGDGQLSFPAVAKEIIGMCGDAEGFETPIAEAIESADAESAEAGVVGAFRSFETPIEIALGTGGVHVGIDRAVVSFLIDDEAFRPGIYNWAIFVGLHRANFERDARDFVAENADAIGHVIVGDEFGMLPRDEENVAETLCEKFARFFDDFIDGQRDA